MSFRDRLPKLNLSRPMLMIIGAIFVLLIIIVVVAVVVLPNLNKDRPAPEAQATAEPTDVVQVPTSGPVGIEPTQQAIEESTAVADSGTEPATVPETQPAVAEGSGEPKYPAPTQSTDSATTEGASTEASPEESSLGGGTGSGESQPQENLPETSSGLPWLIPVGAVLLAVVAWWRWHRVRAAG